MRNSWMVTMVVMLLGAAPASAQIARVFLSGTGNDLNDCSNIDTPCRSLQGAIDQCPVKGEVIIITSGGFGTATITKSVTVDAAPGIVAFNARSLVVNIAATDIVTIRHLTMNGAIFGDTTGVSYISGGTLNLEDCDISGFSSYEVYQSAGGTLRVTRSAIHDAAGSGIQSLGSGKLSVSHSSVRSLGTGVLVLAGMSASVTDSTFSGNGTGIAVNACCTPGVKAMISVARVMVSGSTVVALSANGDRGVGTMYISSSSINANNNTVSITTGVISGLASVISFGNNAVSNNTTTTPFSSTAPTT